MKSHTLLAAFLVTVSAAAFTHATTHQTSPAAAKPSTAPMSEGEVRKVDKDAAKLTLRHGPLLNLDMPGMTMAFRVSDPKFLSAVKEGDKVRFFAENQGGLLTVTRIEKMK